VPISSAFQLALAIYCLDPDPAAERRKIWEILRPGMDAAAATYLERLAVHTPFYRDLVTKRNAEMRRHIVRFTEGLFVRPFDEHWVADTKARVEEEIAFGLDMRNRCVISQIILAELGARLAKRYRYSGSKVSHLTELAMRVLLLDVTNAVALHYNAAARDARGRSTQLTGAVQSFREAIAGVREAIISAATALEGSSNRLAILANSAVGQANNAASAADNTALSVNQMAAATEQMMASISEIRRQATTGASMARAAVDHVDRANVTMRSLSDSVGKISSVTGIISDIADQTNLLALNATIEAARAGEAGKGFAIVAGEVKTLAAQTSHATEEIEAQIEGIGKTTLRSVEEIAGTGRAVGDIAGLAEAVAGAVNEQAMVTGNIARGITEAAGSATTVAAALKTVAEAIQQTQALAASVLESARQLSGRTRQADIAVNDLLEAASNQNAFGRIADLHKAAN
jgi:methyl-accepting chemotaxis protein